MALESKPLTCRERWRRLALLTTLAASSWGLDSSRLWSCPFCYTGVASAKAGVIHALRSGILILILPPLAIFAAILVAAVCRRHRYWEARDRAGLSHASFGRWEEDQG